MNFETRRVVSLGGRNSRETSREELVSAAKLERAQRGEVRQRTRAATRVQSAFRGWAARRRLREDLKAKWLEEFGNAAATTEVVLPVDVISGKVLAPVLLVYLPPGSHAFKAALQLGAPVVVGQQHSDAGPLKGALALVLRSIVARYKKANFMSLASAPLESRMAWLWQCKRLLLLCSAVIGSEANDLLLQTAAARAIMLMTDDLAWRCYPAGDADATGAVTELNRFLGHNPALARAVRRLTQLQPALDPAAQGDAKQLNALLQATTTTLLRLLTFFAEPSATTPTKHSGAVPQDGASPAFWIARHVLAAAHLPGAIPPIVRDQLTSLETFRACLSALQSLPTALEAQRTVSYLQPLSITPAPKSPPSRSAAAANRRQSLDNAYRQQNMVRGSSHGAVPPDPPTATEFVWAMSNIALLVAGQPVLRQLPGNRVVHILPKSPLLAPNNGVTLQYVRTLACLLTAAMDAAPHQKASMDLEEALLGLWPLSEGGHITQLLAGIGPDMGALGEVAGLYAHLLQALPLVSRAGLPKELAAPYINSLAFGCPLLPKLWRWLAINLGLPLDAPSQAVRGWDIASLQAGITGLPPQHTDVLGLFCRVYAHVLLVLDDEDFYERQSVFALGEQRAIATALNTLIFRTHCPALGAAPAPLKPQPNTAMLRKWAPILLRALYERDVRRQYCPAALWLAPYEAAEAAGYDFSAAAVVRLLLQGGEVERAVGGKVGPAALAALLREAPQCVPFHQHVLVLRSLIAADKERLHIGRPAAEGGLPAMLISVGRGALLEDGYAALRGCGAGIKAPLKVTFISAQGYEEAGLDYGGLVKEFLEEVMKIGFNADYGLFTSTRDGLAYPQPTCMQLDNGLALLEFLGLVVGKALYEGILLDAPLAHVFITKLQGRRPTFDDLATLDPEVHHNLLQLKRYEGNVEDLCLQFVVEDEALGARNVYELKPDGANTAVTDENRLQYIHLVADWHLQGRLGAPAAAFANGLHQVIPANWLRLFNQAEVNQLLSGGEGGGVDLADLQRYATYSGGYRADSAAVKLFWKVAAGFTVRERQALLKFATSCSRPPLGGFQYLNPPLVVHKVDCGASLFASVGGKDVERLPTASTCNNMLKLPNYRRASTMREKLLYAINANAGFELS